MRKSFLITLIALIVLAAGSAFGQFPKYLYGIISIFGDDYAGKTTASGETYDPDQLTAAHQTLPFGTELLIENLENGRKAKVRIIDRGPLSDSRIMDVSREAADQLGFIKKGTVYAKVTLVKIGDNKMTTPSVSSKSSAPKESASSSVPSETAVTAPVPSVPVTAPVPQVSVTPSVTPPSPTKTNVVMTTNTATLYETNTVEMTNYSDMTVTNVVDIPPYEEKFVEQPVEDRKTPDMQAIQDEFILDEPVENTGEKSVQTQQAPEPELPLPEEKASVEIGMVTDKTEKAPVFKNEEESFVPETLSSNEEAVSIEKSESQGEALLESGGKGNFNLVVQAGAFRKEGNALRLYETLRNKGYDVFTSETKIRGKKWFRVRVGYFNSMASAKQAIAQLKKSKIKAFLVKVKK